MRTFILPSSNLKGHPCQPTQRPLNRWSMGQSSKLYLLGMSLPQEVRHMLGSIFNFYSREKLHEYYLRRPKAEIFLLRSETGCYWVANRSSVCVRSLSNRRWGKWKMNMISAKQKPQKNALGHNQETLSKMRDGRTKLQVLSHL